MDDDQAIALVSLWTGPADDIAAIDTATVATEGTSRFVVIPRVTRGPAPPPAPQPTPMGADAGPMPTVASPPPSTPPPAPGPPQETLLDDNNPLDTPELQRGLSTKLAQMEDTFRDTARLVEAQRRHPTLQRLLADLKAGRGEDEDYILADDHLLLHAPRGRACAIAVPKELVPTVLALVHGTYGHPGAACTTLFIERKSQWSTLKKDVLVYVLSCKCRRRKRAWSTQLLMIPARLLQRWEVLEMGIQDPKVPSDKGNHHLLVVVDRASTFLTAFPLPSKKATGLSRKLLELLLIFGLPFSIRCDPGSEFTAEMMQHLCRWLKMPLNHGATNHPRAQGAVEKVSNVIHDRLSFTVQLNSRRVRRRKVRAPDLKPWHVQPHDLRLPYEDEFAHLGWSADLGLADTSVVAVPLYTVLDRRVDCALSSCMTEDEAGDSFSPLQLDAFHALYEAYHGEDAAPRPIGPPTLGEREVASRE
ncbi:unnamed protein product [Ectocarpus sp. CCAP 1310/34]|nr:unnamed protein product [Ectocarpus sp. CCAP 1310/34]